MRQLRFGSACSRVASRPPLIERIHRKGKYVVGVCAYKHHLTFSAWSPRVIEDFKVRLGKFVVLKKCFQIPVDWEIDRKLVKDLARARLAELDSLPRRIRSGSGLRLLRFSIVDEPINLGYSNPGIATIAGLAPVAVRSTVGSVLSWFGAVFLEQERSTKSHKMGSKKTFRFVSFRGSSYLARKSLKIGHHPTVIHLDPRRDFGKNPIRWAVNGRRVSI